MHTPAARALRTILRALLGVAALVLLLAGCGGSDESGRPAPSGGPTVTTKLLSFEPAQLTVKAGTTVTWHAGDSIAHTVTTGTFTVGSDGLRTSEHPDGVIDQPLQPGHDVTFTFDKPGTYTYYCSIHHGMSGAVVVEP
jgi:plastocyanin